MHRTDPDAPHDAKVARLPVAWTSSAVPPEPIPERLRELLRRWNLPPSVEMFLADPKRWHALRPDGPVRVVPITPGYQGDPEPSSPSGSERGVTAGEARPFKEL